MSVSITARFSVRIGAPEETRSSPAGQGAGRPSLAPRRDVACPPRRGILGAPCPPRSRTSPPCHRLGVEERPRLVRDEGGLRDAAPLQPAPRRQAGDAHPATLVLTADHDDRVVPAHSHEFTAALQAAQAGDAPVLARLETRAGHGAGKPTAKLIAERTDVLAFLVRVLGVNVPPGLGRPSGAAPLGGAR
ncbi:MAG TPA: prolyl oligopeptidase family serine peptidase [Anaeromyxobacter sp.]